MMETKKIKVDLRKGLKRDFITDSLSLSKEILSNLPLNEYDLVIKQITDKNRDYDINIKTTQEFLLSKIEKILNDSFNEFENKKVEEYRELLVFEVRSFTYKNSKNYMCDIDFDIVNRQLSEGTGTGVNSVDVCLVKLDEILNIFKDEVSKLNLNKNQLDYLNSVYEEVEPLRQNLSCLDDYILQEFEEVIKDSLENLFYEEENSIFNNSTILELLNNSDNDIVELFLDKININEVIEEGEVNQIEIYLFNENDKLIYNKEKFIKDVFNY